MLQTPFSTRLRIEKIELQNFKGVANGTIEFNCLRTPVEKDTSSDLLGIYGQNGSGKTTLLEALHVAKLAMMGQKIPYAKYGNMIAQGADSARMTIMFQASNPDGTFYHIEYAFSLGVWEIVPNIEKTGRSNNKGVVETIKTSAKLTSALTTATIAFIAGATIMPAIEAVTGAAGIVASQIVKSSNSGKEVSQSDGKIKRLAIFDEVLNLSGMFNGTIVRFGPIFDTRTTETVFMPKSKQKSFFPNGTATAMKELKNQKKNSLVNSKSFIFCDELSQMILQQDSISKYAQIILDLKAFAIQNIRVLDSKIGATENETIPLYTANRRIDIARSDSTVSLDDEGLKTLQVAIKGLNIIMQQVIPGLSLEAVQQVDIDLDDRKAQLPSRKSKATVYSVRDNIRIPFAEESAGIIRLISSMGLFSYAFVNDGVTVAIDEIDAGVYEYLLGELLLVFEEYGSGQLIFTCHNLRPMEVLNKKYIYFTTTNPENRYLKPKSIRNENNLRDVYLREIVMGGQEEDLYSSTKHGKIASALQKAGEIIG